jgi:phosphatidylglycerophosphate synthase
MVLGGVPIYFAFVFDCVDGQVARYARKFGALDLIDDQRFRSSTHEGAPPP